MNISIGMRQRKVLINDDPPAPEDTITNNTSYKCLKNAIDTLLIKSSDSISKLVRNTFSSNSPYSLAFYSPMYVSTGMPAETTMNTDSLISIAFSKVEINGGSQEFIFSAVLHEMVHALLVTDPNVPQDLQGQHTYMLQNYSWSTGF
ncbi:MAG: hypothetical protein WDN26_06860 [Chitinophagaceae bacterium]